jgi:hypothetical protein
MNNKRISRKENIQQEDQDQDRNRLRKMSQRRKEKHVKKLRRICRKTKADGEAWLPGDPHRVEISKEEEKVKEFKCQYYKLQIHKDHKMIQTLHVYKMAM